jgi:hypothetical protein
MTSLPRFLVAWLWLSMRRGRRYGRADSGIISGAMAADAGGVAAAGAAAGGAAAGAAAAGAVAAGNRPESGVPAGINDASALGTDDSRFWGAEAVAAGAAAGAAAGTCGKVTDAVAVCGAAGAAAGVAAL